VKPPAQIPESTFLLWMLSPGRWGRAVRDQEKGQIEMETEFRRKENQLLRLSLAGEGEVNDKAG